MRYHFIVVGSFVSVISEKKVVVVHVVSFVLMLF